MEDDALGTMRKDFEKLYSGLVYDAMSFDLEVPYSFVLAREVKPAWRLGRGPVVFGPAFTCRGAAVRAPEHVDDLVRIEMFRHFRSGCVQVIDTGRDRRVAHFGDISGKLARKFGAVGAVIDGYTRDLSILEQDEFPVFCRGVVPVDAFGRWQIVEYQTPVTLPGLDGDVVIRPDDYVFADADGCSVIRRDDVERVLVCATSRLERENRVREELARTDDVEKLYHEIGRW